MRHWRITVDIAPALGDLRRMGRGNTIWVYPDAPTRHDWGAYMVALGCAVNSGADVRRKWDN